MLRVFLPRRPLLPLTRIASGALTATSRRPSGILAPSTLRLFSSSHIRQTSPTRARQLASPPPSPSPSTSESSSSSSAEQDAPPKDTSLKGRLKHLFKTYGWYALGVYAFISIFDFGLSFAAINLVGAEHVREWAARAKALVFTPSPEAAHEAEEAKKSGVNGGLWAMLLLAYTLHKTVFLPVRIGLTATVTPPLVRWLRTRGWAGGAGTRRAVQEMREKVRERRTRE